MSFSPIIGFGLHSNTMVVCTAKDCHIFKLSNLEDPIVIDQVNQFQNIVMSSTIFAIVSRRQEVNIFSCGGKRVCSPRFQGVQNEALTTENMALSRDTIAFIDHIDKKVRSRVIGMLFVL